MYKYEMHCHTAPVSACAVADVRQTVAFYKELGYDGVFITNHFLNGNIRVDPACTYEEKIIFYFADYEQAVQVGREMGIKVFCGVEISYLGTDFLIYGLDKDWYLQNPQIMEMDVRQQLDYMRQCGAYVAQAHPYREAGYIDHIRLYPRSVDGVEVVNANRTEQENRMAGIYAAQYGLQEIAGSDNHAGPKQKALAGMVSQTPIDSVQAFIAAMRAGTLEIFHETV